MVMVSAARDSAPAVSTVPTSWPAQVMLFDEDGAPLGDADVVGTPRHGRVMLGEVSAPERLIAYYFGKARRSIMIDLTDRVVEGRLEPRWDGGGRDWWVELGST